MKKRLNILVSGHVQGVGFRLATTTKAQALNLTGWVKNKNNDQVEIVAEGEENDLKQLLDWTQQGPARAQVTNIQTGWQEFKNKFNDFQII